MRTAQARQQRLRKRHKNKRRQKDAQRGQHCTRQAAQQVSNESGAGKERAGRQLAGSHGIQQLALRDPAQPHHQVRPQKRQQHIADAVQHRPNFQEHQKQNRQRKGQRTGCSHRRQQRRSGRHAQLRAAKKPPAGCCARQQQPNLVHTGQQRQRSRQTAKTHIGSGQRQHRKHGGRNKTQTRHQHARIAGALQANMNHQLSGVGAGDQVGRAHQIQELLLAEPLALHHQLLMQQRCVRCWPAKCSAAQAQKHQRQLRQGCALLCVQGRRAL